MAEKKELGVATEPGQGQTEVPEAKPPGGFRPPIDPNKEFLSVKELSQRIPYSEGAIRNMISQGDFLRGLHYVKPKGRVVFRWSRVVKWLESEGAFRTSKRKGPGG